MVIMIIVNMVIIEGLSFNYPNLLELVRSEYDVSSRLMASLPTAFLIGFFLLATPLGVFFAKLFGSRRVAVVGSIISAGSMIACSFQDNIYWFIFTYGCLNGKLWKSF